MRKEVMDYIKQQKQLEQFIREQPIWFRKLSRNPNDLKEFEMKSLHFYGKTIPHQVEKFTNSVQLANMMLSMLQAMNTEQ